jgi:hypothetical protein
VGVFMTKRLLQSVCLVSACALMAFTGGCDALTGAAKAKLEGDKSGSQTSTSSSTSPSYSAPTDTPKSEPAPTAGMDPSKPGVGAGGQPLPTGKMTADGLVVAEVTSLKRTEGDTLTLKLNVRNNSNEAHRVILYENPSSRMNLMDLTNRRVYQAGASSNYTCNTEPKSVASCWVMFAAPPPEVLKMTVNLPSATETIEAPITP